MKVYLDNCSLQRPLDTKSQARILLEAEAILIVMDLAGAGQVALVASEALRFEITRNPNPARKELAFELLSKAKLYQPATDSVVRRARRFITAGVKPLDALHLASAIEIGADYFCTCDDRLLKRARTMTLREPKIVSPLELIAEIDNATTAKTSE